MAYGGAWLSALLLHATHALQSLMDGSLGPGDEADAPWSAVCLAVLVQRANDKVAGECGGQPSSAKSRTIVKVNVAWLYMSATP